MQVVRELTGDVYFGAPKGITTVPGSTERQGFNNMIYTESEIRRIAKVQGPIISNNMIYIERESILESRVEACGEVVDG